MSKYNRGKIYSIIAPNGYCYIGSTIQSLSDRFTNHKSNFKRWIDNRATKTSVYDLFIQSGPDNCKIELIENFPCDSRADLERREGEIIKNTKCINKVIAGRKSEEYRRDNAEILSKKFKEFYNKNKEEQIQRVKDYYQEHIEDRREYGIQYAKDHVDQKREYKRKYRSENPEKVREQKRLWRETNRDKVNQRKRELYALKRKV